VNAERMLDGLLADGNACAFDELPNLIAEHAGRAGLHDAVIYLADLQRAVLRPVPGDCKAAGEHPGKSLGMDSTLAGRALRNTELLEGPPGTNGANGGESADGTIAPAEDFRHWLWVPLLDGADRLGVLRLTVHVIDEATQERARRLAALAALLIVSKRPHSDAYARLVRTHPMSLAAEVQWTLMPPATLATNAVAISALLEPAYAVGGDAFDFALDGPLAHLCILDSMGHDLSSGLVASLAMASYRNNRLRGSGIAEISEAIDSAVSGQFDQTRFVTGILALLDTRTGDLSWVNRGHPPPLVIRQGRWITELACPPAPPMGMDMGIAPTLCRHQLEPGDRLLFYTDGIVEARSPDGEPFGLDRFTDFIVRREADGLTAPETLRRLIQTVLAHQNSALQDDATVLLAEWRHSPDSQIFS
jgi:serine phosphatase RsbU (regulator of sigma subunit)